MKEPPRGFDASAAKRGWRAATAPKGKP
jgi:hypothetical protein